MTDGITAEVDVTSFHPGSRGGGILIGRTGAGPSSRPYIRVRIGDGLATREPRAGETWRVTGTLVHDQVHGDQVEARLAQSPHRSENGQLAERRANMLQNSVAIVL